MRTIWRRDVFICTDYQACEDMPCERPFVDMPALDRLCKEGAITLKAVGKTVGTVGKWAWGPLIDKQDRSSEFSGRIRNLVLTTG